MSSTSRPKLTPLLKGGPALVQSLTGKRPDRSTLYRWVSRGCKGVHLDAYSVGNELFIDEERLLAFFDKVTKARRARRESPAPKKRKHRRKSTA